MFVELQESCFPPCVFAQAEVPIAPTGPGIGGTLTRRGDRLVTHILLVITITSHAAKCADTCRRAHSLPGVHHLPFTFFMGPGQNVSTVWKMSQYQDFVPRMAPAPINDPVCILKSAESCALESLSEQPAPS